MLKDCPPFIVHRRDDHGLRHLRGSDPRLERHRAGAVGRVEGNRLAERHDAVRGDAVEREKRRRRSICADVVLKHAAPVVRRVQRVSRVLQLHFARGQRSLGDDAVRDPVRVARDKRQQPIVTPVDVGGLVAERGNGADERLAGSDAELRERSVTEKRLPNLHGVEVPVQAHAHVVAPENATESHADCVRDAVPEVHTRRVHGVGDRGHAVDEEMHHLRVRVDGDGDVCPHVNLHDGRGRGQVRALTRGLR
mmetsp:Transcript_11270/g.47288  ORF Transcript_11270/g.47288 Transcript_11270/m.47288 type:complete len:251 (-) Transcript_11270:950-1702(-)